MMGLSIAGVTSQVRYGQEVIRYTVRTNHVRSSDRVSIHVENNGIVFVDAPSHASTQDIKKAVTKRIAWINKHIKAAEQRLALITPREYISGETTYYLGRRYRLKVIKTEEEASVSIRGAYIQVKSVSTSPDVVRKLLDEWYLLKARKVLSERLANMCESLRWIKSVPPVSYRKMSVQWGSCSPNGRITLNVALIKASGQCIDYVLLHELCHLKHHNHGKGFYRLLSSHMPEWQGVKARLDGLADAILAA